MEKHGQSQMGIELTQPRSGMNREATPGEASPVREERSGSTRWPAKMERLIVPLCMPSPFPVPLEAVPGIGRFVLPP